MTKKLYTRWEYLLQKKAWEKQQYYEHMLHLDETLKLLIRTSSKFCSDKQKKDFLFSFLPKTNNNFTNVHYEWGVWFQVLKGIIDNCIMNDSMEQQVKSSFIILKTILQKQNYLGHFLSELKQTDYTSFKKKFNSIGLNE